MEDRKYNFAGHGFNLVKVVSRILGDEFEPRFSLNGVAFYHNNGKVILRLIDSDKHLEIEYYISVPNIPDVLEYHKDEEENNVKLDTHWVYKGSNIDDVIMLTEVAIQNFKKHYH